MSRSVGIEAAPVAGHHFLLLKIIHKSINIKPFTLFFFSYIWLFFHDKRYLWNQLNNQTSTKGLLLKIVAIFVNDFFVFRPQTLTTIKATKGH